MRILGIDYGTKRIGIAISDPDAQFALPHSVLQNSQSKKQSVIDAVAAIATSNDVTTIIIGESRNYKGEANKILPDALELKKELEARHFTVHLELEFMTSQQAERFQGKTENTDASAAALILQSYLDSHRNK
ncbi:MAG TPA: RuvX/YqgF family protein [Candidatus Paceibacterota bacterium]|jgi:putative Holliday junction resolvase|nr:RuvX/YqgF family protein [Candidatus Paceibacterota bacterium]